MKKSKELKTAIKAAKKAGKILVRYFYGDYNINMKNDNTYQTEADVNAEKKIIEIIQKNFPEYSILCEEKGEIKKNSEYKWVIDPLDGTTHFVHKNPEFGIIIALSHNDKPILGVVYLPVLKELYYAEEGYGAYFNGKKIQVREILPQKPLICFEKGSNRESNKILLKLSKQFIDKCSFRIYCTPRTLAAIGRGLVDAYVDYGSKPWDKAADTIIARESGCLVTNFKGEEWKLFDKGLIAANKLLNQKLTNEITEIDSSR